MSVAKGIEFISDRLRGVRILVLDDEEIISQTIRCYLVANGGTVETASDGVTALQKLLEANFDLVTVDLLMPKLNGLAFVQAARKIWPWLGFIIVTGIQQSDLLFKAKALGISRILHKPFQIESLADMVRAEADDCVKRIAAMPAPSINRIQQHHRILRHIAATVATAESFVDAMLEFQRGIAQIHPVDIQAVLGMEGSELVFVVNRSKPVSGAEIDKLQGEAAALFGALTGKPVSGTVARVLVGDPAREPEGDERTPKSAIMLPILTGNSLQGLLVLASMDEDLTQTLDISFFLSAANTLSSVMAGMSRMRHLANHDYLTGLCNRAYFEETLKHALSVSRRNDRPLSMLLMDLDNFKKVNDTHGHRAGDQVLREFAQILSKEARESDLVVRLGGDEFAVLMPETAREGALTRAHRIIASVASQVFLRDEHRLNLTTSAGLAGSWNLDRSSPPSQMLLYADLALYGAKQAGRNTVRVWEAPVNPSGAVSAGTTERPRTDEHQGRILVVDDEKPIADVVSIMLSGNGYAVDTDTSAADALSRIADNRAAYDLVLTDLNMPGKCIFN
ncbi:MAG: diguanylate cyclase [Lentisphaerae bacterium]|nr:diguanylate cyclase [Lentisphaerota bacterium]